MARHNVERATGQPSICSNPRQILSYDTPQIIFWNAAKASSLGPKCTVPTSNAFEISSGCWPRTRRPHAPGSGHDPLRTSRSRVGWAECRPGTDRCSLPLLPFPPAPRRPARNHGTEVSRRRSCRRNVKIHSSDPTTSLLPARLIGVDPGACPQRLHQGFFGWAWHVSGLSLHGTTQCGARHGETQHLLESQP